MTTLSDSMISKHSRDRLYFDQYRYGMRFKFWQSGRMRSLNHDDIVKNVLFNNQLAEISGMALKSISSDYQQIMLDLSSKMQAAANPFKRIVYTGWQYVYTNHLEEFTDLESVPGVDCVSYTEAVPDQPRDTVVVQHSDYQWRTYFREKFYTKDQLATLSNFIMSRSDQFRTTDTWCRRLTHKHCYITRSFFVDHHDQKDVLLLQIALPGCVRKTVPIVSRQ